MKEITLDALLQGVISDRVIYFPIRHHSPACSLHLEWLIRDWKPQSILIEGPSSFTSLIPLMLHSGTKAPFAIYTSVVIPESPENSLAVQLKSLSGPSRYAAYYPFCDYSPELVALRTGQAMKSSLRFIDLDYPEQVHAERNLDVGEMTPKIGSLLSEPHLQRSRYLRALAKRAGCRDHNDLWDHFFETRSGDVASLNRKSVETFIGDVAGWCHFARVDADPEELKLDGTTRREMAMASAIKLELNAGTNRILVVTGGFHTAALPSLVEKYVSAALTDPIAKKEQVFEGLIRYSYEQLDALNGYASGMPSPYFYDQLWKLISQPESVKPNPFVELATKILVELGQLTRRNKLTIALSAADEIAALGQACRLASLRNHPGPTREDLLDGVRSCFVKGAVDAEGSMVMNLARQALTGFSVGEVPPEAGVPPLVNDFRNSAGRLRFDIKTSLSKKTALDLYRKRGHRLSSRFLHSLRFLEVPFAMMTAGPDFVAGTGLDRLFEHWQYQWTPRTESQLIEAGIFGATIEEACVNRLSATISEQEQQGYGRSAATSVGILIQACRMGLHRHTTRLVSLVVTQVNTDFSIVSISSALNQLVLLWESREPLEAHHLPELSTLIVASYERSCFLLHSLANTSVQSSEQTLQSVQTLREILLARADSLDLDPSIFYAPLKTLRSQPSCPALLLGGVTGFLFGDAHITETELLELLAGSLSASSPQTQIPFLVGLLRSCRELSWRQPAIVSAVQSLLETWTDEEFIQRIPHLRMAFADLTPRETDQVATVVSNLHHGDKLGSIHYPQLHEEDAIAAHRLDALVKKSLADDGLLSWMETGICEAPTQKENV